SGGRGHGNGTGGARSHAASTYATSYSYGGHGGGAPGAPFRPAATSLLQVPRNDLRHAAWMAGLTPDMVAAWQIPEVSLHVVTNNRLLGLRRLCRSLLAARYLGDRVAVHFHVDVDADDALTDYLLAFPWPHGPKEIHRRVRRGGLIAAVTESFHPATPHQYAVLLEEDVEVSPLYYSWVKHALLRYRY
ncbi:unnamed protein product, partial [Phaeothamnion confervicola]